MVVSIKFCKKITCDVLGIRTQRHRMEGTDESNGLWSLAPNLIFIKSAIYAALSPHYPSFNLIHDIDSLHFPNTLMASSGRSKEEFWTS